MPPIHIVDKYQAIQYTGSNSAEIDAAIAQLDIVSESGGVLIVESPPAGGTYTINTGEWVRYTQGFIISVHTTSAFNMFFIRNAVHDDIAAVETDIADLQAAIAEGIWAAGVKESPTLLLGQSAVVPVDIIPAMPDTSYTPTAQLFAAASALGSLSITNIAVVDTNTVNVTVQNSGLVNLSGVHILVVAKP